MIEVTCGACGTTHRFAESEVPPGGRTATCTACKATLQVPGAAAAKKGPLGAGPSLDASDPPELGGGTGDIIDLAELPAPRRASPLAGAPAPPPRAGQRSPLADALSDNTSGSGPGSAIDLGDINLGLDLVPPGVDLNAPTVRPQSRVAAPAIPNKLPPIAPPRPAMGPPTKQGIGPGVRPGTAGGPGAPPSVPSVPSVPSIPKVPSVPSIPSVVDLPAPKRASTPAVGVPTGGPPGITDLPAPKRASTPAVGVPTGGPPGITDLPAPKRAATPHVGVPTGGPPGITDLPAPKRPSGPDNLPAPKRASGLDNLPAPKRATDASAKAPAAPASSASPGGGIDLPAPKGFFDDLPVPLRAADAAAPTGSMTRGGATSTKGDVSDLPAPKGFFDDLPGPASDHGKGTDLPVPKGFFDDLPGPAGPHADPIGTDLAPKGFFDDGPAPAKAFFDDLPAPPATIKHDTVRPGKPLDLDDLELAPHSQVGPMPTAPPLELEPAVITAPPPPVSARRPQPQTAPPPAARNVPALELPDASGDPYGGLDLPPPTAGARPTAPAAPTPAAPTGTTGNVVSFKPATRDLEPAVGPPAGGALDLDIESAAARARSQPIGKAPPRRDKDDKAAVAADKAPMSPRVRKIAMASALVVVAGAAGGFFFYSRWKKQQRTAAQLESGLQTARAELASGGPRHWDSASAAAESVLAIDGHNADALALSAEAAYAGVLDEGTDAARRTGLGNQRATDLTSAAATGLEAEKALALKTLVDGQPDRAAQRLDGVLKRAPSDPDALLFMGWAHLGAHQWKSAVDDFDRAAKALPARDLPALYGRAQAKLALGDRDGALADFDAVLKKQPDHIGAQVGQAAAAPASQFEQRGQQLAALLARKDIATKDPRAVAQAWTLWGDDARLAGRLDAAGDRYKHALALDPTDQAAMIGQADLALRGGRADVARDLVDKALARDAGDLDANLLSAEIDLQRGKPDDALARLTTLAERQPPIEAAAPRTRMLVLTGKAQQAQGKLDDALGSFKAAAALAGDSDVAPTIAAVQLLGARATAADASKDATGARAFRQQAEDLLAPLAARAQNDPAMAVTLGVAYLQSGAPERAEPFLTAAVAARPKDVEALFQLAEAQARNGKKTEALATRQKAFDVDPARVDVGVALAREYELAGQDAQAGAMYGKLVKSPDVTLDVRARAGRFWARTGDFKAATEQSVIILGAEPDNAAGLYLQAEGLLADSKLDLARRTFQKAADYDPQAQYFDGLGRANEALWHQGEDTRFQEDALRAYGRAIDLDDKDLAEQHLKRARMFNPQLGRGRLLVERNDFARALEPLDAARAIKPDDPDVAYLLGVALDGVKRYKEAAAWLIKANQLRPRAESYKLLGEIYGNDDQPGPAAASFAQAVELALAQEKKTGQQVEWLTDMLYEFWVIETARDDRAGIKRIGNMFLNRNPKNPTKVDEVRRSLLSLGQ